MRKTILLAAASLALLVSPAMSKTVYLDKLDKGLDDWWNALDVACRGEPGESEASNRACDQRGDVDEIIKKKGCWNIYPATNPHDTSYWKCKVRD